VEVAKRSRIVVTNYACWISNQLFGESLGHFDALILDEAHNAPDEICGLIGVELTTEEVYQLLDSEFPEREEAADWRDWAKDMLPRAELEKAALAQLIARSGGARITEVNELRRWSNLCRKLSLVAGMAGPWCVEASRKGYKLDPLWPSQYAERALFAGIPKVYAYSATATPKTMYVMGVKPDELEYYQYPSSFPPRRSPVYRIPTCKVDRHMDAGMRSYWIGRMDQILATRGDRKGIIHCVSYQRREEILKASEHRKSLVGHSPEDMAATVEWFRASKPPLGLVSPSVSTGYDFPGSDCEFQIIAKMPFPDTRSKVMQAREKSDPLYIPHLTVQTLQQATGRGMRYEADQCENFIVDDHVARLLAAHRDLFLDWWLKLYHRRDVIPDPPPPLKNGKQGY
jgi:Rad3-related DNA helicase